MEINLDVNGEAMLLNCYGLKSMELVFSTKKGTRKAKEILE